MSNLWVSMQPRTEREAELIQQFADIQERDEAINVYFIMFSFLIGFVLGLAAVLL